MAERDGRVVDEKRLPGRQGPVALVYLALERSRPVSIDELADAVWGESLPRAWETALSAIVSKLPSALGSLGLGVMMVSGRYQFAVPVDA
jgi:DNA-binding SARP family transcriptional activator